MKFCCMLLAVSSGVTGFAISGHAADLGWNQAASGTFSYLDPENWVNGTINGVWDGTLVLTGSQNVTFDADAVLSGGLDFRYDGAFNTTLRGTGGDRMVTLAGDINVITVATNQLVRADVELEALAREIGAIADDEEVEA